MFVIVGLILLIIFIIIIVCGTSSGRSYTKNRYRDFDSFSEKDEPYPMDPILKDGLPDYPVIDEDYDYENDRYYSDGDDRDFF